MGMRPRKKTGDRGHKSVTSLQENEAETERNAGLVEILSEGVYAYLKRKGLLADQGDQTGGKAMPGLAPMAGNRQTAGNAGEDKILDE